MRSPAASVATVNPCGRCALNENTATGQAFLSLAQSVVTVVNRRNREQPPTEIVGVKE